MNITLVTALSWCTFFSFFLYRYARDENLNYQAGRVFRAWVVEQMSIVLANPNSSPLALRYADLLLSLMYDRSRLREIAKSGAAPEDACLDEGALGRSADAIRVSVQYVAILMMMERRGYGNSIRKFLSANGSSPFRAVQLLASEDEGFPGIVPERQWVIEAVNGLAHSPQARALEHAIEGQLTRCAA